MTVISIAIAVVLIPFIWRTLLGNTSIPGVYSYIHMARVSNIPTLYMQIVMIAAVIAQIFLLYRLLKIHTNDTTYHYFTLLMLAAAPATIALSAFVTPYGIALAAVLLCLNLMHTKIEKAAFLPLIILLWTDWISIICSIIIVNCYAVFSKKTNIYNIVASVILVIAGILMHLPLSLEITQNSILREVLSDFGGLYGISLFAILMSCIGLVVSWNYKRKIVPAHIAIVLMSAMTAVSPTALLFLSPILVLFAAYALKYFWDREWSLPFIRSLTLLVIVYGILFSSIAAVYTIAEMPPSNEVIESVKWLSNNPFYSTSIILSHAEKGYWLGYGTVTPFITYGDENYEKKLNVTNEIFLSGEYKKTIQLLKENKIELIWIDQPMKNGQVWTSNDEGLLYFFSDPRFLKIYDSEGIEIWRFK